DFSATAFADRAKKLRLLGGTIFLRKPMPSDLAMDLDILQHAMRAEVLDIDVLQTWKINPVLYVGKPAEGIDLLMKRTFAPPAERLRCVIGRLKATPAILAAMKANVANPPREFADLGLIVAKGS